MFVDGMFCHFNILSKLLLFPLITNWLQAYRFIQFLSLRHSIKDSSAFYRTFFINVFCSDFTLSEMLMLIFLLLADFWLNFFRFRLNILKLGQADPGKYFFGLDDILNVLFAIPLA